MLALHSHSTSHATTLTADSCSTNVLARKMR